MDYFAVLFHPSLLMASLIYSLMAISFEISYQRFLHHLRSVASSHWVAMHIGAPFFHVLLLVAFIYMSYPVLYGVEQQSQVPTLTQLLNAHSGQTMKLVNILFIISLLLPLFPLIHRFSALILPLQAIAGSAVLYGWLAQYKGINYTILPDIKILALLIGCSVLAELLARALASMLSISINPLLAHQYRQNDLEKLIHKSVLLIVQVPILLIYTLNIAGRVVL